MDPLSIAGSVAGFLSLTIEIVKILSNYTSEVQDSPKAARSLLTEVIALKHVLEQLTTFLQAEDTNSKCRFQETSALYSVITICKTHIQTLFRKLKFQCERDFRGRLKWPFSKEECTQLIDVLHRCTQTFTFSLTIENCSLLSKTSTELNTRLDDLKNSLESLAFIFPNLPVEMTKMRDTLTDILDFLRLNVATDVQKIFMGVERVEKSIQGIEYTVQDDKYKKILEWLSPLEPLKRHQDVLSMRLDNTGGWLLNDQRFIDWWSGRNRQDTDEHVLCCYGMPGAGKTFLTAGIIVSLSESIDRNFGVACIYCDYRDQSQQTPRAIFGSIVAQLLACMTSLTLPPGIVEVYESASKQRISLKLEEAIKLIVSISDTFERVFICIDAIDELEPNTQQMFLQSMRELLNSNTKIRLFLTGRPHIKPQVHQHLSTLPKSPIHTEIEIMASEEDIKRFLLFYIEEKDPMPDNSAMNEVLKLKIIETITAKSGGMYVLPALHIKGILEEPTIGDREDALEALPSGLYGAFKQTIDRIRQQPKTIANQGMTVLTWVFLARRTLSLEELRYAVAVRTDGRSNAFDKNRLCSKNILLGSCLGLVTVDEETSTVRLVHYSLQEYLQDPEAGVVLPRAGHELIAKACLTYLCFCQSSIKIASTSANGIRTIGPEGVYCRMHQFQVRRHMRAEYYSYDFPPPKLPFPLMEYAALEWGHHARDGYDPSLETLAINYLTEEWILPCTCVLERLCHSEDELLKRFSYGLFPRTQGEGRDPRRRQLIHHAAYFGEPNILMAVYNSTKDTALVIGGLNTTDRHGRTALTWAAIGGHTRLVRDLIDHHEIDVDVKDITGRTPLAYAVWMGSEHPARLLLSNPRVDPNSKDHGGHTPLSRAVESNLTDIACMLLQDPRVDPNSKDDEGHTPLSHAVQSDFTNIARILLQDPRVDPNSKDHGGHTPLSRAVESNLTDMVCMLLQDPRVDPNSKDSEGHTPLSHAVQLDFTNIARILLQDPRVDPNSEDNKGRTPLLRAGMKSVAIWKYPSLPGLSTVRVTRSRSRTPLSNLDIVRMLVQDPRVDPNSKDHKGHTPLSRAVESNLTDMVCMLLQDPRVDPNSKDREGHTPLSLAAGLDFADMICMLLQDPRVDPNSKDSEGHTPLSLAAGLGLADMVRILLRDPRVDPSSKDREGRTLLSRAVESNHTDMVRILLQDPRVDPNSKDNTGHTPLSRARLESNRADMVRILLHDVPNYFDNAGRTHLSRAVINRVERPCSLWGGEASLILQNSSTVPDLKDKDGRTPLSYAAEFRRLDRLLMLLQDPCIDPDSKDNGGRTPLSHAVGYPKATRVLLQDPRIDPDSKDNGGRTPLSHAAARLGFSNATRVLLQDPRIDPNSRDNGGRTPLSYAAEASPGLVKLFLDRGADPNLKDINGMTPLDWALRSPKRVPEKVIELLKNHMNRGIHDQATLTAGEKRRISLSPELEPSAKRQVLSKTSD